MEIFPEIGREKNFWSPPNSAPGLRPWSRLSCRANIIRTDRRNLLKLINKHLGKHIISIFIHEFISLHYYYLIVTFLYYQKCAKTHLQQCRNLKIFRGRTPGPPALSFKKYKKFLGRTPDHPL